MACLALLASAVVRAEITPKEKARVSELDQQFHQLYQAGKFREALPMAEECLEIFEKALGSANPNTAFCLNNLGTLHQGMGNYAKAEPLFLRSLEIREKTLGPTHHENADILNNLAELYDAMGDYTKAEPIYLRALQISEMTVGPTHPDTATSLNNLEELYDAMGARAKAEPLLQRALQINETTFGLTHPKTANNLNNLAELYHSTGELAKAEPLLRRALQINERALGPTHPHTANSLNNLALIYNAMNDYAKAEPLYQRALQIREKALGRTHPDTAITLDNLALLKIDQGRFQDAFGFTTQVRSAAENQLFSILSFASERQRLDFQKSTHPYSLFASLGRASELAETVLHQKGVVLDSLLEDRLAAAASSDPALRETIDQARSARQRLSRLLMEVPKDFFDLARQRREAETQTLTAHAEQLESTLSRQVSGFGRARRALSVKVGDVQGVLSKQEALIELLRYSHYLGKNKFEPRYGAVVIAAGGEPKWMPLGSAAEIEKSTALYQKSVRGQTDEATLGAVLKALHERVWSPIAQALPAGTASVILSADGDLNFVSFATLLGPDGQFLAQKYLIGYVSSGRDLLRTVPKPTDTRFVFFGNPDFGADTKTPAASPDAAPVMAMREAERSELGRLVFPPLPGTERECTLLDERARKGRYQTELRLGAAATEQTLAAVKSPRVLHLATHGFFLPEPARTEEPPMFGRSLDAMRPIGRLSNPMYRSGLVLAGAQRTIEAWARGETPPPESDGILTAEEVSALHLDGTWLVTLSACETGVGAARSGEGVLGLRRAFVQAGAQHLLMTLWPISDETTIEIMSQFYTAAFTTADPGRGLAEVQRAWLEKLRKEKGLLFAVNRAGPFIVSSLGHAPPPAAAPPAATPKPPQTGTPAPAKTR